MQRKRFAYFYRQPQMAIVDWIEGSPQDTEGAHAFDQAIASRCSCPDMAISQYDEFSRGQPFQPDRTTGVKLVGADPDFGS